MPKTVKKLTPYVYSCFKPEKIILQEGLEEIDNYAFCCGGPESIVIPKSVTKIEKNAFERFKYKDNLL